MWLFSECQSCHHSVFFFTQASSAILPESDHSEENPGKLEFEQMNRFRLVWEKQSENLRSSHTVLCNLNRSHCLDWLFRGQTEVSAPAGWFWMENVYLERSGGLAAERLLKSVAHTQMCDILMSNLALLNLISRRCAGVPFAAWYLTSQSLCFQENVFEIWGEEGERRCENEKTRSDVTDVHQSHLFFFSFSVFSSSRHKLLAVCRSARMFWLSDSAVAPFSVIRFEPTGLSLNPFTISIMF